MKKQGWLVRRARDNYYLTAIEWHWGEGYGFEKDFSIEAILLKEQALELIQKTDCTVILEEVWYEEEL